MTDNEKRAHDIAVAMIPVLYDVKKINAKKNNDSEFSINTYDDYMTSYKAALKSLGQDFHD